MLMVIACLLVFFPAAVSMAIHGRLSREPESAFQKWMWYGTYCAIIGWAVLAVKLVRLGGAFTVLNAFSEIRYLVSYGLVSLVLAVAAPLVISIVRLLFEKVRGAGRQGHE